MDNLEAFICKEHCRALLDQWSEKFAEMDKDFLKEKRLPKRKEAISRKRGPDFAGQVQKKMKGALDKLKQLEVIKLYRQTQKQENLSKGQEEGQTKKGQISGVLVDREQE